ncbi:MAG: hypothetical protein R3324_15495, partial [Halobacteriales archaeon]|nr:hypothetical protein [Halobacteriales archaeon]
WGTLDMNRDTQFVRVIPIRETLAPADPNAPLNATVVSTDLDSGRQFTWRDSVITFPDGRTGHVFYAPFRTRPGHTYRIEISSAALALVTRVETTAPALPEAEVLPEEVTSVTTPGGADVRGSQEIVWRGIDDRPFQIEQWYRFLDLADQQAFLDVQIPFELNSGTGDRANSWMVRLNLAGDQVFLSDSLNALDTGGLLLAGLGQAIVVLDEAFVPPGGVFDPEILAQPGTLSNVENGFGFVGSIGRFSVEWTLSDEAARTLGYTPASDLSPEKQAPGVQVRVRARPWE